MVAGANAAEPREATEFGANLGNLRMFQLKVVPKFLCQITSTAKRDAALGAVPGNRCSDSRFVIGTRRSNPNYERGPRLRCRSSSYLSWTAHELRRTSPRLEAPLIRSRTSEPFPSCDAKRIIRC